MGRTHRDSIDAVSFRGRSIGNVQLEVDARALLRRRDPARSIVLRMITRPRPASRRAAARATSRRPRRRCGACRRGARAETDRPALAPVAVLDRVVAGLGDREHRVRRWSSATPRRSSHAPRRARRVRSTAGSVGTSISMDEGTSSSCTSSRATSSEAVTAWSRSRAARRRTRRPRGRRLAEQRASRSIPVSMPHRAARPGRRCRRGASSATGR